MNQVQERQVLRINGETGSFGDVYLIIFPAAIRTSSNRTQFERHFFLLQPCLSIFRRESRLGERAVIEIRFESRQGT